MKQINISYGGIIIIIHSTTLGSLAFPEESEIVDGEGKGEIDVCVRSRAVTIPLSTFTGSGSVVGLKAENLTPDTDPGPESSHRCYDSTFTGSESVSGISKRLKILLQIQSRNHNNSSSFPPRQMQLHTQSFLLDASPCLASRPIEGTNLIYLSLPLPFQFYFYILAISSALLCVYIVCNLYNLVWIMCPQLGTMYRIIRKYQDHSAQAEGVKRPQGMGACRCVCD